MKKERIDLLTDKYLRGKYSFSDVLDIAKNKVINFPVLTHKLSRMANGQHVFPLHIPQMKTVFITLRIVNLKKQKH